MSRADVVSLELGSLSRLYGREEELRMLHETLERVRKDGTPECVIVHGAPGIGKTCLVQAFFQSKNNMLFVSGRFEEGVVSKPFYAFVDAMDAFCQTLAGQERLNVQKALGEKLSRDEASSLAKCIPSFSRIQNRDNNNDGDADFLRVLEVADSAPRSKFSMSRHSIMRLLKKFFCIVSHALSVPLVFFLDDMQWADPMSLRLWSSLVMDPELDCVLFLVTHRSHPHRALRMTLHETKQHCTTHVLQPTELTLSHINELIANVVDLKPADTLSLAQVVHDKTGGNGRAVLTFLQMLQEEALVEFSFEKYRWTWDAAKIKAETHSSDRVVDSVLERFQRLHGSARSLLRVAACFGPQFDARLVAILLSTSSSSGFRRDLDALVLANLVERDADTGRFRFTHERIQQAAYHMTEDPREREQWHLRIGKLLLERDGKNREWVFFSGVDQLNRGCMEDPKDRVELAQHNLRAGNMARRKSAFVPAASFFRNGMRLLNNSDKWEKHYELTLDLASSAAEMEHCLGNPVACLVQEVLEHAKSLEDKQRAHVVLIQSLGNQGKTEEAIRVGLQASADLGESFSDRRKRSGKLAAAELICETAFFCFFSTNQQRVLLPHLCTRLIQLAAQHKEYSAVAFSLYGQYLSCKGDKKMALRNCNLARKNMDTCKPHLRPRIMLSTSLTSHWTQPLRQSLDPLLSAYCVGMETGNVGVALLCAGAYCATYVHCGLPLQPVAEDMRGYMQLVRDYAQDNVYTVLQPVWQHLLNLVGDVDDPLVLAGEAMDEYELRTQNRVALRNMAKLRFHLSVLFGNHERSERLLRDDNTEANKLEFGRAVEIHGAGITYFGLARKSSRRRRHYLRKAQRCLREMEEWVRGGNVNCHDMYLLLRAENMTFQKKAGNVKQAYDEAIASASRCGFVHRAAQANELAAGFCGPAWAETYLRQAHQLYIRWGAWSKVKQLEAQHDFLESDGPRVPSKGSFQGRPRFSRRAADQHEKLVFSL